MPQEPDGRPSKQSSCFGIWAARIRRAAKSCRRSRSTPLILSSFHLVTHLQTPRRMLDPIAGQIERYMDLLSVRQKLVTSNIANVDTPGYHTQDIDFQSEFLNAAGGPPRTVGVPDLQVKNDGNDVSLDRESRLLSENAMRFQLASNLMRSQIRIVRSAIQEGKS
jgi:flagellar basal-body rod protein FlgB